MKEEEKKYEIPVEGSLGLLALGHTGLLAWREKRRAAGQATNLPTATDDGKDS